ncbi:MAG: polysaccharide pyruvyl transferase family protein [Acidimicrobiia bacterium]
MPNSHQSVVIAGGYTSYRHLGDDLIIRSILAGISSTIPDAHPILLAEDPEAIADRFSVDTSHTATHLVNDSHRYSGIPNMDVRVHAIADDAAAYLASPGPADPSIVELADQMASSRAFVIAAAGSLTSAFANWMLFPRLTEALIAQYAGVPVAITGAGLGPVTTDEHERALHELLSIAAFIDVRDRHSLDAAAALGIERDRVVVGPDAAVRIEPVADFEYLAFCKATGIAAGRYVIVGARQSDPADVLDRIAAIAGAIASGHSVDVLLMPHVASGQDHDGVALQRIGRRIDDQVRTVLLADIPQDRMAADMIRRSVVALGTRFHNGVLACFAGTPALLWSTSPYDRQRIRGLANSHPGLVFEVTPRTHFLRSRALRHSHATFSSPRQSSGTETVVSWLRGL